MEQKSRKLMHFADFHIAGFAYWEGCIAFNELKIGSVLTLEREADNSFDPYAVAIYYGDKKLGFIPKGENEEISKLLDMGYRDIFDVRINQLAPDLHPQEQVSVIVYLKRREA